MLDFPTAGLTPDSWLAVGLAGAVRVVAYREDEDRGGPGPLLERPSWPNRGPRADLEEGRRKAETYGDLWSAKAEGLLQRAKVG